MKTQKKRKRSQRAVSTERALTKERVVWAAVDLLDRVGTRRFGIRELAKALGVYPTTLYWHIGGGLNVLVAEMVAAVLSREVVPPIEEQQDWKAWLGELFRRWRAAVQLHPHIVPLVGALTSNPGEDASLVESVLTVLERAGFKGQGLVHAYNTVISAMVGFPALEFAPEPYEGQSKWAQSLREQIENVNAARFPVLARHKSLMANRAFITRWQNGISAPLTSAFEFNVRTVIDGLGLQLDRHATRGAIPRT